MEITQVTVTPTIAKIWLEKNKNNRPIKTTRVNLLAKDIANNNWKLNGETIKFDNTDTLIDGQHRLMSVIKANKSITTFVVRGLETSVYKTLDTQAKRSTSDVLFHQGEKSTYALSGALRVLKQILNNEVPIDSIYTTTELVETLDNHPEMREAVSFCHTRKLDKILRASISAALYYVCGLADSQKRDEFFEGLLTGVGLNETDPRYVLRERLLADKTNSVKLTKVAIAALAIKAWNAFYDSKPVGTLRWARKGVNREEFPKIRGFNG